MGSLLDRRYRIDATIARGGMSTVYRALDTRLDRPVAVKIMDPKFAEDPQFVARFEFEARAVARLNNPGLVAVYDHGRDGEFAFLVMELVEGGTLRELLRERGPMPPHAAAAVIRPVLDAIGTAHRAGLVHRDIKPENILVSDSGDVKIADFGLVRAVAASNTTSASVILGTAAYLSPEQVTVGSANAGSDVYGVGVVLFELLTGRTPFTGDTSLSIAYQRIDNDVPRPSSIIAGVPPEFDELVRLATVRDPAGRYQNADEMGRALREVAARLELPPYRVPAPRGSAEHRSAAALGAPTTFAGQREVDAAAPATKVNQVPVDAGVNQT
ncbi:MAG: protein kinase, partial [Terrimesophilobacter sp.]